MAKRVCIDESLPHNSSCGLSHNLKDQFLAVVFGGCILSLEVITSVLC